MKLLIALVVFMSSAFLASAQTNLVSYEDIKYLLHNNLHQADTFLMAKGYTLSKKDNNTKNRKYSLTLEGGTHNNINIRSDGKKLFIQIETNELNQYNLIKESIAQYITKDGMVADVQTYVVKDLCTIYIMVNDTQPYNPLRKDYDIQIVADRNVTAYN